MRLSAASTGAFVLQFGLLRSLRRKVLFNNIILDCIIAVVCAARASARISCSRAHLAGIGTIRGIASAPEQLGLRFRYEQVRLTAASHEFTAGEVREALGPEKQHCLEGPVEVTHPLKRWGAPRNRPTFDQGRLFGGDASPATGPSLPGPGGASSCAIRWPHGRESLCGAATQNPRTCPSCDFRCSDFPLSPKEAGW